MGTDMYYPDGGDGVKSINSILMFIMIISSCFLLTPHPIEEVPSPMDDVPISEPSLQPHGTLSTILPNVRGSFQENIGQFDQVNGSFAIIGDPFTASFSTSSIEYLLPGQDTGSACERFIVRFMGSNPVDPVGVSPTGHRSNYLLGNDPSRWVTGVRSYAEVEYTDLYDGIDLRFSIEDDLLKYEFVVEPLADPSSITISYDNVEELSVDPVSGDLLIDTGGRALRDLAPRTVQPSTEGDARVESWYLLDGPNTVTFKLGDYDPSRVLVIDPGLTFSTFICGSKDEHVTGMCVDDEGYTYLSGYTESTDLPTTPGAVNTTASGYYDAFVIKVNQNGTDLVFCTYLGGVLRDYARDIAVDGNGCVYITGSTGSPDFPTTDGAFQTSFGGYWSGESDAYLTKLSKDGSSLLYSTYIGAAGGDWGLDLYLEGNSTVFMVGETTSNNFPLTMGAFDKVHDTGSDLFALKLNLTSSTLVYSTFIGGDYTDTPTDIFVDANGSLYIAGVTTSDTFPTTPSAYDRTRDNSLGRRSDIFMLKLDPTGSYLEYSTYVGGRDEESCRGLSVDASGCAYVTGKALYGFPVTAGAYDTTWAKWDDVFVLKLNASGSNLVYSTYIGGNGTDEGWDIHVDSIGRATIVGLTNSKEFPTTPDAFNSTSPGSTTTTLLRAIYGMTSLPR